jgi:hypothetical protein
MAIRLLLGVVVAAVISLAVNEARAAGCTGAEQYTDDFTDVGSWSVFDGVSINGGKMIFKEPATKVDTMINTGFLVGDGDICIDVSLLSPISDLAGAYAIVIFWQVDWNNYYELDIAPNGQAAIFRMQNGKSLRPVDWTAADSLKAGPDMVNSVRLSLKGNSISVYFNDKLFKKINGLQPKDGGAMGFGAGAEEKQADSIAFSKLRVTDPSP